jgi:hypothetical protein
VCDPGSFGYDCSLKQCPRGDDPLTLNQVNEIQLMKCTANSGSFTLYYEGNPSAKIAFTANQDTVEAAIQAITGFIAVKVIFSQNKHASICQTNNPNIVTVEFIEDFGPLRPLVAIADKTMENNGGKVEISADGTTSFVDDFNKVHTSVKGTKENDICSNRGVCTRDEGICKCFDSHGDVYVSSNGYGSAGSRGDCGYLIGTTGNTASACLGEVACNGHGNCNLETMRCECYAEWSGGDCSEKSCPVGYAWFGYPSADNTAHDELVECSHMGKCGYRTGTCECRAGFYGEACQYMSCDEGQQSGSPACSGHGRCLSMAEHAYEADNNGDATDIQSGSDVNAFATTWDYNRIHGCKCDPGFSGYDCSLKDCPTGDDSGTYDDHQELQILRCKADAGNFTLSFRQQITRLLPYNVNAVDIEVSSAVTDIACNQIENDRHMLDTSIIL